MSTFSISHNELEWGGQWETYLSDSDYSELWGISNFIDEVNVKMFQTYS